MSFVQLGLVNVRRNLGRSVLAVLSMAVASLVVTSLLSLAPTSHAAADLAARFLLGGDVLITPLQLVTGAADLDPANAGPERWGLDRLPLDAGALLSEAVPWAWSYGFLGQVAVDGEATRQDRAAGLTDEALRAIESSLAGQPKVSAIAPLAYLPVLEPVTGPDGELAGHVRGVLIGRDPETDLAGWGPYLGELLAAGRYLSAVDAGQMVALCDEKRAQRGFPAAGPGATLTLLVPRAVAGGTDEASTGPGSAAADSNIVFDYGAATPVQLTVVGSLSTVTALELTEGAAPMELSWGTGAIFVPRTTLDALARQAGLPEAPVAAVAVRAADLVHIDRTTVGIRDQLPSYSVFSVHELSTALAWTGAVVPLTGEVTGEQVMSSLVPRGLPLDLNLVFAVLAFTIAAMIVAANLLVLLTERRREIAVLRSLGARSGDIAIMVQTEALVLSAAGCVLGFWPVRLLATLSLVSNRLSAARIAALTLADFGVVCGIALAMAALFGLLPALASTRTTCMEALRND